MDEERTVLAIVGSPRGEEGTSYALAHAVLRGAQEAGAATRTLLLAEEEMKHCIHCGHSCFSDGECAVDSDATERSALINEASALILAAPVYCWQPNALTCMLFDKYRIADGTWMGAVANGRPALGIAVAGGSGTGVFPALQSIYGWLCVWRYRPLDPLPVTRFNLVQSISEAPGIGARLAEMTQDPWDDTAELMRAYDELKYLSYRRIDEFEWLARAMQDRLGAEATAVTALLEEAQECARRGDDEGRARAAVSAYETARAAWED